MIGDIQLAPNQWRGDPSHRELWIQPLRVTAGDQSGWATLEGWRSTVSATTRRHVRIQVRTDALTTQLPLGGVMDGPSLRTLCESFDVPLRWVARTAGMSHGHFGQVERGEYGRSVTPKIQAAYEEILGPETRLAGVQSLYRLGATYGLTRELGEVATDMLYKAVRDLPDVPVSRLWDRFVAWTEPVRTELPVGRCL